MILFGRIVICLVGVPLFLEVHGTNSICHTSTYKGKSNSWYLKGSHFQFLWWNFQTTPHSFEDIKFLLVPLSPIFSSLNLPTKAGTLNIFGPAQTLHLDLHSDLRVDSPYSLIQCVIVHDLKKESHSVLFDQHRILLPPLIRRRRQQFLDLSYLPRNTWSKDVICLPPH